MDAIAKFLGFLVGTLLLVVVVGLLVSLPVMLLWNFALVPAIPGLVNIGWLQAWGILILCSLLFKTSYSNKKD